MALFLVRSLDDGTIRTISGAETPLGALRIFSKDYDPPPGRYEVKERGRGTWQKFRIR